MGEFKRKLEARRALARTLTPGEYALVVGKCPTHRLMNSIPARVLIEQGKEAAERARLKGKFDGNCNRSACQEPIAGKNYWNVSTRAYYCHGCAEGHHGINFWSRRDDGRIICLPVTDPADQPGYDSDRCIP